MSNKLGNSTNLKIGKKTYSSRDFINHENAPHNLISKDINNQSSVIQTKTATNNFNKEDNKKNIELKNSIYRKTHTNIKSKSIARKTEIVKNRKNNSAFINTKDKVQNSLENQNDSGSATLSTTIDSSVIGFKAFKQAQKISPHVVNKTYLIATSIPKIATINSATLIQFKNDKLAQVKIVINRPVKKINNTVAEIKTAINTAKRYSEKTISIAQGVVTGNITNQNIKDAKKAVQLSQTTLKKSIDKSVIGFKKGRDGVGKMVLQSDKIIEKNDEMGLQAVSVGIKMSNASIKVIKTTPTVVKRGNKTIKTIVNKQIQTGKAVSNIGKEVQKFGIKNTISYNRKKALKSIKKTSANTVNVLFKGFKKIGIKIIIPILLMVVVTMALSNMITAPVSGVSAIFGGAFSIKSESGYEDYETHNYLLNAIPSLKEAFAKKISNIRDKAINYEKIKLFNNGEEIDITEGSVISAMPSNEEITLMIEPIFSTILLTKYSLEPSTTEVNNLLSEIFNTMFKYTTEDVIEYCTEICTSCGDYHAIYSCTNIIENDDDSCKGRNYCGGHKTLHITIDVDGWYELLATYFTDEIDRLANKSNRTAIEEDELLTLKDNYELCLNYMDIVAQNYGVGAGSDITNVTFINGSRSPNNSIIAIAEMQLGNVGGQPFWSWYGFKSRVEWCACFVSWCNNQMGYIGSGITPKFCSCREGVKMFKERGQWVSNGDLNYSPTMGDIIFFDWNGDGIANHVGFVVGNDGQRVYTIEGNSGDVCRRKSYALDSRVVLGYGLPNY